MTQPFTPLPFTLSKNLTPALRDFLYKLYLQLREAPLPLSLYCRYRTFETAAVDICSWHIDAISINALEHLVRERTAKGLRRGHRMARKERGAALFDPEIEPMKKKAMLNFFFENDRVTLVTAAENGKNGIQHWSPQILVPDGLFQGGSYSVAVKPADLQWAEDTLRQYKARTKAVARKPVTRKASSSSATAPVRRRERRAG